MSYSITDAALQLKQIMAGQRTIIEYTDKDYVKFIIDAIKKLFIDTGRASLYSDSMVKPEGEQNDEGTESTQEDTENEQPQSGAEDEPIEDETPDTDEVERLIFDYDFLIDEEYYIMLCARLGFLQRCQLEVNEMVSYTTNALSVTQGDKPYANLQKTIDQINKQRRIVYYKMCRYALL